MRASHPAYIVHKVKIVLRLKLVGSRTWADLKTRTAEGELVDRLCNVVGWAIDAEVRSGYGGNILQAVFDTHVSEAKIIHQRWRKKTRFIDAEETRGYREIIGEIEISRIDAAAEGRAERSLQAARSEWKQRF